MFHCKAKSCQLYSLLKEVAEYAITEKLKRRIEKELKEADFEYNFSVGETVVDTLTDKHVEVIGINYEHGKKKKSDNRTACHCVGYWIDDGYDIISGWRHPWELGKLGYKK